MLDGDKQSNIYNDMYITLFWASWWFYGVTSFTKHDLNTVLKYHQHTFRHQFSINLVRLFQQTTDLRDNRVQSVAFLDAEMDIF